MACEFLGGFQNPLEINTPYEGTCREQIEMGMSERETAFGASHLTTLPLRVSPLE
jgi:hypothetical protein